MSRILIGIVAVIAVAALAFALLGNQTAKKATTSVTTTSPSPTASETQKTTNTVTLTKNGFESQTLKVKAGTKVTFVNKSGAIATVNSDPHPIHTLWPFLNLGRFNDGESLDVTFDKTGTYTYHNHLNSSQTGTVVVE